MTECHDEVCITCSDQLLRVVVTAVDAGAGLAEGTVDGTPCTVSIELIDGVSAGDVLLCHGGAALQRADGAEVPA